MKHIQESSTTIEGIHLNALMSKNIPHSMNSCLAISMLSSCTQLKTISSIHHIPFDNIQDSFGLEVSPMQIGRTLGFLSRATSQQLRRGCKASGSINDVEILYVPQLKPGNDRSDEAVHKKYINVSSPKYPSPKALQTSRCGQQCDKLNHHLNNQR